MTIRSKPNDPSCALGFGNQTSIANKLAPQCRLTFFASLADAVFIRLFCFKTSSATSTSSDEKVFCRVVRWGTRDEKMFVVGVISNDGRGDAFVVVAQNVADARHFLSEFLDDVL